MQLCRHGLLLFCLCWISGLSHGSFLSNKSCDLGPKPSVTTCTVASGPRCRSLLQATSLSAVGNAAIDNGGVSTREVLPLMMSKQPGGASAKGKLVNAGTHLKDTSEIFHNDLLPIFNKYLPGAHFDKQLVIITTCTLVAALIWLDVYFRFLYKADCDEAVMWWLKKATYTFQPGEMGITYDDQGFVEEISPASQALAHRISKGDQIVNIGTEEYSKAAVIKAEKSGSDYEVTFKVSKVDQKQPLARPTTPTSVLFESNQLLGSFRGPLAIQPGMDSAIEPDVVIVFHNPTCESIPDRNNEVNFKAVARTNIQVSLQRVAKKLAVEPISVDNLTWMDYLLVQSVPRFRPKNVSKGQPVTWGSLRKALIQDLNELLACDGFHVSSFKSIDDDELFFCISLMDEEELKKCAMRDEMRLQIQHRIVRQLNIAQPSHEPESSPPFMCYDPHTIKSLYDQGVLSAADGKQMYRTYHARNPAGSIINGKDRIRIILNSLGKHLDLDTAKSNGLIVDWYCAHNERWLANLNETWSNWSHIFSFVLPVTLICDYFGALVSFSFVWQGVCCRALLGLMPVALFYELAVLLYYARSETARTLILGPSIVIICWTRILRNLWHRERDYLLRLWGLRVEDEHLTHRRQYRGFAQTSDVDTNMKKDRYPHKWARFRKLASGTVSCIWAAVAFIGIIFFKIVFEEVGNFESSAYLVVIINFLQLLDDLLAVRLTAWANHPYEQSYFKSLLWRKLMFSCASNYSAFFYTAFWHKLKEDTVPGRRDNTTASLAYNAESDDLNALWRKLVTTQCLLSLVFIGQVGWSVLRVYWALKREDFWIRWSGHTPRQRSFVEQQAKCEEYTLAMQVKIQTQLMTSLGYIMLFGAVAPLMVPFSFIVFAVSLRVHAFLLTTSAKRPEPLATNGDGMWPSSLANTGVLVSGFLLTSYGETFETETGDAGMPVKTRLIGLIGYCVLTFLLWNLIDAFFPKSAPGCRVLAERRAYVKSKIFERVSVGQAVLGTMPFSENWNDVLEDKIKIALEQAPRERLSVLDCSGRDLGLMWSDHDKPELRVIPETEQFPLQLQVGGDFSAGTGSSSTHSILSKQDIAIRRERWDRIPHSQLETPKGSVGLESFAMSKAFETVDEEGSDSDYGDVASQSASLSSPSELHESHARSELGEMVHLPEGGTSGGGSTSSANAGGVHQ